MNGELVEAIRARLRAIADSRCALCKCLSALDDERERLLAQLEQLDRRAYRDEAM